MINQAQTGQYRFTDGTLFKLSVDKYGIGIGRYVAVFTDYRFNTKKRAIKAYEESLFAAEEDCEQPF